MKFSATKTVDFNAAIQGSSAEAPVTIPWLLAKGPNGVEKPVEALVRALDIGLVAKVRAFATKWAEDNGRKDATEGDEVYDEGKMMATVALALLDAESPAEARELFYDSPMDLVGMAPMRLVFLYEHQDLQQDKVSPYSHKLSTSNLLTMAREVADREDDRPFIDMSPATRAAFARGVAKLLCATPELRSHFIALSSKAPKTTSDTTSSSPSNEPPAPPSTMSEQEPAPATPDRS